MFWQYWSTGQREERPRLARVHRRVRGPRAEQRLLDRQKDGSQLLHRRVLHFRRRVLRRHAGRRHRQKRKNVEICRPKIRLPDEKEKSSLPNARDSGLRLVQT